jgi:hypothetical protein
LDRHVELGKKYTNLPYNAAWLGEQVRLHVRDHGLAKHTGSLPASSDTLGKGKFQLDCYDYATVDNPPILHRKESFLPADYPAYETFAELTRMEEEAGLLENTATIGTRNGWRERLFEAGMSIEGHQLQRSPAGLQHRRALHVSV